MSIESQDIARHKDRLGENVIKAARAQSAFAVNRMVDDDRDVLVTVTVPLGILRELSDHYRRRGI